MKNLLRLLVIICAFSINAAAQNVGIGTNNPSVSLHVVSPGAATAAFEGPDAMFIILQEAGFYRGYIGSFAGDESDVDFGTGVGNTNGKTHLAIQGVPKLTVDADGNTDLAGELQTSLKTGTANMLAICYGNVNAAGGIETGSGNFSVSKLSTGGYAITITGEPYNFQTYIAVVTAIGSATPCFTTTGSGAGKLQVFGFNTSGVATDTPFQFVVYKP